MGSTLLPAGHSRPDPDDPAGALQARVGRSARWRRVEALPLHHIRRVDTGRGDLDQDLTLAGNRIRYLFQTQYFGPTRGGDDDRVHGQLQKRGIAGYAIEKW
jgi:hypothetical protein